MGAARPFALDYGAVMLMAQAMGSDLTLLADVLPGVEAAMLNGMAGDEVEEEGL